jgi:hypothetical protein
MVVKVRYNDQHNGNIISGVLRDWSKGIHSVNIIPRPKFPHCT